MIAGRDATSETMLRSLSYSIGALEAAAELDVDRTPDDTTFFVKERDILHPLFDTLFAADQALSKHLFLTTQPLQSRVILGDAVLDRGVRAAKARMKIELKGTTTPDGADHVFPSDISDITDAERRVEPTLVQQVIARFPQVPDFPGKDAMQKDLDGRATRQTQSFAKRDAGEVAEFSLDGAVDKANADGSDALYRLEKRLLERFPRDKVYVRAFFLDVAPPRKKAAPAGGGTPG